VAAESLRLHSVREVADRIGVHPETIRRLIHDGRLPAVRVGRTLCVDETSFAELVAHQRLKPRPPH